MSQIVQHVRNQLPRPAKDERGITLQTLIVTAVLVLMAVAAGVIIAAITNSSSDDLEEQTQDIPEKCAPWELHQVDLEAIGAGGGSEYRNQVYTLGSPSGAGRAGVTSSKIGCLPVCYLTLNDHLDKTIYDIVQPGGTRESISGSGGSRSDNMAPQGLDSNDPTASFESDHLKFNTENRIPNQNEIRVGVIYARRAIDGTNRNQTELGGGDKLWNWGQIRGGATGITYIDNPQQIGTVPPFLGDPKWTVRVSDDKEGCVIEDTSSGKPEIRMKSKR